MPDLRPPLGPIFAKFGEPRAASVIPPDGDAVAADIILGTTTAAFPAGSELAINERRRTVTLKRAQVVSLPRGSRIELDTPVNIEGRLVNVLTVDSIVSDDGELIQALVH